MEIKKYMLSHSRFLITIVCVILLWNITLFKLYPLIRYDYQYFLLSSDRVMVLKTDRFSGNTTIVELI